MNKNRSVYLIQSVVIFLTVIFITSCSTPSKYQIKDLDLPERFVVTDTFHFQNDTQNLATISWKDYFKEPELIELIEKGLAYNFDMKQALNSIKVVEELSKQAKQAWLPQISAELFGVNQQYRSENYYSTPSSNWYEQKGTEAPSSMHVQSIQNTSSINLSWEIDLWGKIRNQKQAIEYQLLETEEHQKIIQTKIITQIAEAYYNLLLLYAQLEVAKSSFELSRNTYSIVELQYESGNTTALAKQQTKSQMLTAKALIPSIKEDIALQENLLNYLTGDMPSSFRLGVTLWTVETDTLISYGVPLELISNRPDVKAQEYFLKSMNKQVGVAQANKYPQLKIDIGTGTNAMLMQNWWNIPGSIFGSFVGGLTQPIFNKRKLKTDYEIAKINRDKAELEFQRTAYLAVKEVSDALVIINSLEQQLEIGEEQFTTTVLAINQSNLLFNSGYASYLEIINAQKTALESELNLNQIRYKILVARLRLYSALGGGWS